MRKYIISSNGLAVLPYERESFDFFYDKGYFLFDDLSEESQRIAKETVLIPEYMVRINNIKNAMDAFKENKHKAINDSYHIRRILNGSKVLQKIKEQGDAYLLSYIRQNIAWFTKEGYYVSVCDGVIYK